jgi:hypothetical protein
VSWKEYSALGTCFPRAAVASIRCFRCACVVSFMISAVSCCEGWNAALSFAAHGLPPILRSSIKGMHPSRMTSMASVAGMVSGPKGMHAAAESKKKDEAGAIVAVPRVIRRDPDAIHRTGSLRDLFEMCRLPGNKRELKEFLKVSPHLCRRTITYGKGHSYGIGWYPCHYPGCVSVALRWSIHRGAIT